MFYRPDLVCFVGVDVHFRVVLDGWFLVSKTSGLKTKTTDTLIEVKSQYITQGD